MPTTKDELKALLELVPDWSRHLTDATAGGATEILSNSNNAIASNGQETVFRFLEQLGPRDIYLAALNLGRAADPLLRTVRDHYLIKISSTILGRNPTLKRYFLERRVDKESQKHYVDSLAAELSMKLDEAIHKKLAAQDPDGFKVLLPAYIQSSGNNAVIDFVKLESSWEKTTLQDMSLDGEKEDPRETSADDTSRIPENMLLSKEKVQYLNQLRFKLEELFAAKSSSGKNAEINEGNASLFTIDCIFGLGLTTYSKCGSEMTMRECCDHLAIAGETQARKIARCQVLLDRGLDEIRQMVRQELPGIVEHRQHEININTASRRDLKHQLNLTEGEIERLIAIRQFLEMTKLVSASVIKQDKLQDLIDKGAAAFMVPVDLNSAPARDLIDILGITKESAKAVAEARPFNTVDEIVERKFMDRAALEKTLKNGAVLKAVRQSRPTDINACVIQDLLKVGLDESSAKRILIGKPFRSWQELDEYACLPDEQWQLLRNTFFLGQGTS